MFAFNIWKNKYTWNRALKKFHPFQLFLQRPLICFDSKALKVSRKELKSPIPLEKKHQWCKYTLVNNSILWIKKISRIKYLEHIKSFLEVEFSFFLSLSHSLSLSLYKTDQVESLQKCTNKQKNQSISLWEYQCYWMKERKQ